MSSNKLVFITGATGFIGAVTARTALKYGYRLRISVRKEAQIEKVKKILAVAADRLEFVVIPDLTSPAAFSGKLDGVDYVVHMASPLANPSSTNKAEYFVPAVKGTTAIMEEAAKVPSIKKVVITASIAALMPLTELPSGSVIREVNDWDVTVDEEADFTGKNEFETAFKLYHASKILSNQASWKFMSEKTPAFNLISIHPSFVYGHNPTQTTAAEVAGGTNGLLWGGIMAEDSATALGYVAVEDVAEAHIRALDPKINKSASYLVAGPQRTWNDVLAILKEDYPGLPYKLKADTPTSGSATDTTKVETDLGLKWTSLKDVIHQVVDQQLGFLAAA